MPDRRIGAAGTALLALLLCLGAALGEARAHVDARVNVRVVHFDYGEDGMTAYYRLSLALLAGAARPPQSYIVTRKESGHVYFLTRPKYPAPRRAAFRSPSCAAPGR
jgi:hypothetical protein